MKLDEGNLVEGKSFSLLPPRPGVCQECAVEHDPQHPHNVQSLFYQTKFNLERKRPAKWADAMTHCTPVMKLLWTWHMEQAGAGDDSVRFDDLLDEFDAAIELEDGVLAWGTQESSLLGMEKDWFTSSSYLIKDGKWIEFPPLLTRIGKGDFRRLIDRIQLFGLGIRVLNPSESLQAILSADDLNCRRARRTRTQRRGAGAWLIDPPKKEVPDASS